MDRKFELERYAYHLTTGNRQEFLDQLAKLVGKGTFTYIGPDGVIATVCKFDGLVAGESGGITIGIKPDLHHTMPVEFDGQLMAGEPLEPSSEGPRIHAWFMANVLRLGIYSVPEAPGATKLQHVFVANREPSPTHATA